MKKLKMTVMMRIPVRSPKRLFLLKQLTLRPLIMNRLILDYVKI